jgi:hypothetical protein
MSQQPSQDSQSQSDLRSLNEEIIETQSSCDEIELDGPYESCLNCPNETIIEGSCFCLMCYLEYVLRISEDEEME